MKCENEATENFLQIEALEDKIKTEMTTLKDKMAKMEDEMLVYSDLDKLRSDSETKRVTLESQREELADRRTAAADHLQEMKEKVEGIKVSVLYTWYFLLLWFQKLPTQVQVLAQCKEKHIFASS